MTGIAEAAKSRTPLLVLAAEAPEIRSNFHVDVAGLAAAVGAVASGSTPPPRRWPTRTAPTPPRSAAGPWSWPCR